DGVVVQNRLMQRAAEFKMVNIEKWVTFLLLAFILVIATFNVISALSLLIIDKQDAITTLRNLGADNSMITSVFVAQAWIISLLGAAVGIALGLALSLAQEHFGLIAMSGDPATMVVSAYPVKVVFTDILSTFALVIVVGFFTSIITSLIVRSRLKNL
ncbi:MAG: FtsX-like permease family protein, partial [Muribaculaceae bacterium]|nr:FtsX-like permease family protein [Muribaculaceae bacterium]